MRKLYTTGEPARWTVGRVGSLENNENEETPRDPQTRGGRKRGHPELGGFWCPKNWLVASDKHSF